MDNPKNKLKQTYRKIKNLEIQGATAVAKNSVIALKNYGLNIKINNLWNEQYQQIKWFAMPLRTLEGGFTLNFNNSNNKNQKK